MANSGVLSGIVVGWQEVEPILLACISAKINVILRGKHGASKTVFAKLVAQALGGKYRHYDATKDDMVSVAGIPNPEDLKNGILSFSKHDRAIWEADYISIDELTRAPRESQNLWLEILEEKTCNGFPLKYRMALATMNPATYNATYRLDEALLDRFAALVDIPEVVNPNTDVQDIYDIVRMNINGHRGQRDPKDIERLGLAINTMSEYYTEFAASEEVSQAAANYAANFASELVRAVNRDSIYISQRRFIHLANCVIACGAYYKFAQTHGGIHLTDGVFAAGAKMAITHVITAPLNISPTIVKTCHDKAVKYLKNIAGNKADKLLVEINKEKNLAKKTEVIKKHIETINKWSSAEIGSVFDSITAMITQSAGEIISAIENAGTSELVSKEAALSKQTGAAIDKLQEICREVLNNKDQYSTAMKVAAKNNLGALIAQRFKIMQGFAKYVVAHNQQPEGIYTYAQVMANKKIENNGIWDGNLINDSLADTINAILKGD